MLPQGDIDKVRAMMDAAARGDLNAQCSLCDPRINPNAAAYFIFNFCETQDEERGGGIFKVPPPYYSDGRPSEALRFVEFVDGLRTKRKNGHDEKSRRKLHTWLACLHSLWAVMWVPGWVELLTSKTQDHVDDGGRNSKTFSMFGRIRFAWERLPDHVRKPVLFSHMSASCPENDAYLVGRAPTEDAGRGGGYVGAKVDECAFIEWMTQIHAALDPACKVTKLYMGTVNGPDNEYARIKQDTPAGWEFYECDWFDEDPLSPKIAGLRDTESGPERDRYGDKISPWFVSATASLRPEQIAQEYLRKYEKSTQGMIFREFSRERHSVFPSIPYDSSLPVHVGLDLGHTRRSVALIGQPVGMRKLRVIGAYVGEHRNSRDNAAGLVAKLREIGYQGKLDDVWLSPDPNADVEEVGSGASPLSRYRAIGLANILWPLISGADSVRLGNDVGRVMFQEDMIEIGADVEVLLNALPAYRLPIDRATGDIKSNKPLHNMASHPCDAFRYLVTGIWTADDVESFGFMVDDTPRRVVREAARRDIPDQEDEYDERPIMSGIPERF